MKITQIETYTVVVPVPDGRWHSPEHIPEGYELGGTWIRMHWPDVPIVLVRVHTDEGLIGLGEMTRGIGESAVRNFATFLEGKDVWSLNLQELPLWASRNAHANVYPGFEMALFDLMGKALEVPVYRLFGGNYREWVPVSRCSGRMNPDDAAKTARDAVEMGYTVLKMKAAANDPVVERLAAIQDAVGDQLKVNVDANERFQHPYRLIGLYDELSSNGITNVECFESPFNQRNLDWYVLSRQKMNTPVALHMANPRDVIEAVKNEACDWLNIGGSLVNTYKLAGIAEAAGIPTWHGSGVSLGVSEASYVHICAACKPMTLTSDICGETLRENDLIEDPLIFENGHVRVSEQSGLGVELDFDAIERYRVA